MFGLPGKRIRVFLIGMIILFSGVCLAWSQSADFNGQLSGSFYGDKSAEKSRYFFRYIPAATLGKELKGGLLHLDSELSLDLSYNGPLDHSRGPDSHCEGDIYRAWVRLSSDRWEMRGGLQKINFGPARILRSLMWFDRVDPRDPIKMTEASYGLLGRFYFANNSNIWLWSLIGNDDPKGWEEFPTKESAPELGGRFEHPLGKGEFAFTYHHRRWENKDYEAPEDRFALDGSWDLGPGVWFEAALIKGSAEEPGGSYRRFITLGADYTFSLGSGLRVMGEHMQRSESKHPFGGEERADISALETGYNLSFMDSLRGIVYYNWKDGNFSVFAGWSRVFDNWSLHINGFKNPESGGEPPDDSPGGFGKGAQIMVVFNH